MSTCLQSVRSQVWVGEGNPSDTQQYASQDHDHQTQPDHLHSYYQDHDNERFNYFKGLTRY